MFEIVALSVDPLAALSLDQTVIPVFIAVLSSGFVFGLFKVMPERRSILVQASENAVKVVNDAIATLHKELEDARREIVRLETELATSKEQRTALEGQLRSVQAQVTRLEAQLDLYQRLQGGFKSHG